MRKRTTTTTLVALLAAGLTPLALTAPASAAPAKYADDFNGDGYRDIVVSANATVDGKSRAGSVVALYGSGSGVIPTHRKVISQNTSGIPGTAEKDDAFGAITATGDFNADGYADLAVGTPYEDVGDDVSGGTVTIVWGSSSGLSGGTTVADPTPTKHDQFGRALAAGDFNGDGKTDLAIGSTGTPVWIYKGGFTKSGGTGGKFSVATAANPNGHGVYELTAGDLNADGISDFAVSSFVKTLVYQSGSGTFTLAATLDGLDAGAGQHSVAIADVTGDGDDDLVVGTSGSDLCGQIDVHRGGPGGVSTDPDQSINQNTSGIPGTDEYADAFGKALTVGDIDGDGLADVAVGSSDESIGDADTTGQVHVLRGTPTGLSTSSGVQSFNQNTSGIPGMNEYLDRFGWAVQLTDVDADGHADLFIGAEHENNEDGALWYLRGRSTGVTTSNAVSYGPSSVGVSTAGYPAFGSVLTG